MLLIVTSWITTVPPLPMIASSTPCQMSRPASVTMNDGTPITATKTPWANPIRQPAATARTIAM